MHRGPHASRPWRTPDCVPRIARCPYGRRKDVTGVPPRRTEVKAFLRLSCLVYLECRNNEDGQIHLSLAALRLRRDKDKAGALTAAGPRVDAPYLASQLATDSQDGGVQVHISPAESERLAANQGLCPA